MLAAATRRFRATATPLRFATVVVCVVAGFMMATGALASRGNDLRPNRTTELAALVRDEADRAAALGRDAAALRTEVDALTRQLSAAESGPAASALEAAAEQAGTVAVSGPAVAVTLTDAPETVRPAGVDADLLVVHQQDIQAVINALWSGGAEAMTIQGQRIGARSGVKCVGNTVVLHGVPYAPPYEIVAIGDQARLERALRASAYLDLYRDAAARYQLGYEVRRVARVELPRYEGPSDFDHARAVR